MDYRTVGEKLLDSAHSKIGASFASTSSMIDAGKDSTLRALRADAGHKNSEPKAANAIPLACSAVLDWDQ
jgi:hypothetical protein